MMLNNTSWLWKAKAEQPGWGDRSAHFAWEMHQNRGERRWSQGRLCYLALCCLFIKRKRGPWVTSVFCFVFPIALHPYAYSCSAVAGSFLIYTKEYKQIRVEYGCGEQTWVWPRGFVNFVSLFQNPLSTCAFIPSCFLNLKGGRCSIVPQTQIASSLCSNGQNPWVQNRKQLLPLLPRVEEWFNCELLFEGTLKPVFWTLLSVGLPVSLPLISCFWHVVKIQVFLFP